MARTLPARTPGDPAEVQRPWAHVHIQITKFVSSVGHARGAHAISDQDRLFGPLGLVKQADHSRVNVNAITNELRKKRIVIENIRGNTRVAMVQAAHGIEGVGGAARAGQETRLGLAQVPLLWPRLHTTPKALACRINSRALGSSGAMVMMRIWPRAACQKRSNSAIEGCTNKAAVWTPRLATERNGPSR